MNKEQDHCAEHYGVFEYVCTHCNSLLCPQCLYTHPKHANTTQSNYLMHIMNYTKNVLCPRYTSAIDYLTKNMDKDVGEAEKENMTTQEAKTMLETILKRTLDTEERLKDAVRKFGQINDILSHLFTKITFSINPNEELNAIKNEYKGIETAFKEGNLWKLIKTLRSEVTDLSKPRILKEDLDTIQTVSLLFEKHSNGSLNAAMEGLGVLLEDMETIKRGLESVGQSLTNPYFFNTYTDPEAFLKRQSVIEKFKQALTQNSLNEAYSLFTTMKNNKMSCEDMVETCLNLNQGFAFLLSYITQQRIVDSNNSMADFIKDHCVSLFPKGGTTKNPSFNDIAMKSIVECDAIRNIFKETKFSSQSLYIQNFLKATPKDNFAFSKQSLGQYLEYVKHKSSLGIELKKKKPEWAKRLLEISSILQVIYFANQIPLLKSLVEKIIKKAPIPKKHLAITTLISFGETKSWDKFVEYARKEGSVLPVEFLAEICIASDNKELAKKYITKVSNYETQMHLFLDIESYIDAVNVAVKSKKPYLLEELKARSPYDLTPYITAAETELLKPGKD